MKEAYITIENIVGSKEFLIIAESIVEEFDNIDIRILENCEYYFVIKVIYDNYEEIQEIVGTSSYIMTNYKIDRFTITINSNEYD